MEHYTLRKIIEDNAKNLEGLDIDLTRVCQEADYLQAQLPKFVSFKTRVRIACSMLQIAVDYKNKYEAKN